MSKTEDHMSEEAIRQSIWNLTTTLINRLHDSEKLSNGWRRDYFAVKDRSVFPIFLVGFLFGFIILGIPAGMALQRFLMS